MVLASAQLLGVTLGLGRFQDACAAPLIHFEPDTLLVSSTTEVFDVSLWLDTAGDSAACFGVSLGFDAEALALLDATEGDLYSTSGLTTFFDWTPDPSGGARFVDCVLGFETFVLGAGEIVRLTFQKLTEETTLSELLLSDPVVTDIRRQEIPGVEVRSGYLWLNHSTGSVPETYPGMAGPRLLASPNPATDRVWISFDPAGTDESSGAARAARVVRQAGRAGQAGSAGASTMRASVLDASGRTVTHLALTRSADRFSTFWAGRDALGHPVRPGVYFVTLEPSAQAAPVRIVWIEPE